MSHVVEPPAFGEADLSNCEREQIHLAGGIQPNGALLVVREPELEVVQVSANASAFLGLGRSPLGCRLEALPGDLPARIRPRLGHPLHDIPSALRCRLGEPLRELDALFHRPPQGGLVIELEPAGPPVDTMAEVESGLQVVRTASSLQELCDETARLFRGIAGYDRAMVYRFDERGHGEVLSESRNPELDSYLGQRYPASDIPQIARRLYERNRVRLLADVNHPRIPLEPRLSPLTGEDLDMSLCFLRAMSPIHVQYLRNMGVAATLVASLMVGGKLWGLVACHHGAPRVVHYETRAICELLTETVATRIAALESFSQAEAELSVRRLEQRMVTVISRDGDWRTALFDGSPTLLHPVDARGAALLFEGEVLSVGEVPGTPELRSIGAWLDAREPVPVFGTDSLGAEDPAFESIRDVASGLLAARVSTAPGEYLLWFRPAQDRTITWGGNPFKPFVIGDDPSDLSPRRSFAQWHQQVEGTAEPWLPADRAAAKLIGATVSDIVLQFRSVRVLIAQDQLRTVRAQVQRSEHPVVIADPEGRILLTNEAFEALLRAAHPHLEWMTDLPPLFTESGEVRAMLADLVAKRRSRRGEFGLRAAGGSIRPLVIRADPVLAAPDRLLGFVLLITDLSQRREAEDARRRFQESLIPGPSPEMAEGSGYQHLLAAVLGNAQLAGLEITEGVDLERVPEMLESVRSSVERTAELLEHLIAHAARSKSR